MYNVTTDFSVLAMDTGCLPFFRYIACYSVFGACEEVAAEVSESGFVENGICEADCSTFYNRCGAFTNKGICLRNSTSGYCAGVNFAGVVRVWWVVVVGVVAVLLG